MPEPGGEKPVPAQPLDGVAWAAGAFAALNLTWRLARAKRDHTRVLGKTADEQALMDVTMRNDKLVAASAVVPIKPEYTPMLVFLLAALVSDATMAEADQALARWLTKLRRDKPSETIAPWHQWRVTLATNRFGLLTMQVR